MYYERVETLVAAMTRDPGVRLPGQRRAELAEAAAKAGVDIPDALHATLVALAA